MIAELTTIVEGRQSGDPDQVTPAAGGRGAARARLAEFADDDPHYAQATPATTDGIAADGTSSGNTAPDGTSSSGVASDGKSSTGIAPSAAVRHAAYDPASAAKDSQAESPTDTLPPTGRKGKSRF
jgi:hypothetical protein